MVGRKGLIREGFLEETTEYQERVRSEGEQDRSIVRRALEGHVQQDDVTCAKSYSL